MKTPISTAKPIQANHMLGPFARPKVRAQCQSLLSRGGIDDR
jgi:hypothetical protein